MPERAKTTPGGPGTALAAREKAHATPPGANQRSAMPARRTTMRGGIGNLESKRRERVGSKVEVAISRWEVELRELRFRKWSSGGSAEEL